MSVKSIKSKIKSGKYAFSPEQALSDIIFLLEAVIDRDKEIKDLKNKVSELEDEIERLEFSLEEVR